MGLSYTDLDLGIRGRAIGLLARVLYSRNVGVVSHRVGAGTHLSPDQIQGADRALALTPPGLSGIPTNDVAMASIVRL